MFRYRFQCVSAKCAVVKCNRSNNWKIKMWKKKNDAFSSVVVVAFRPLLFIPSKLINLMCRMSVSARWWLMSNSINDLNWLFIIYAKKMMFWLMFCVYVCVLGVRCSSAWCTHCVCSSLYCWCSCFFSPIILRVNRQENEI